MALKRQLNVFLNTSNRTNPLCAGVSDPTPLDRLDLIQSDKFELRLYFGERTANAAIPITNLQLEEGNVVFFSGKETSELKEGATLFEVTDFEEVGEATPWYYAATLNLRTVNLLAKFAGTEDDFIDVTIDVEVQDEFNTERVTFQFKARVHRQVFDDAEDTPADAPEPADYLTELQANAGYYTTHTGGGATAIDGIPTTGPIGKPMGYVIFEAIDDLVHAWKTFPWDGIETESVVDGRILPDDADDPDNLTIWKRIM